VSEIDDALREWLPHQRWYGGKGKAVAAVQVAHEERLPGPVDVRHTLLEVVDDSGATELYQLLLGYRDGDIEPRLEPGLVGHVKGQHVYDAVHDLETPGILLRLLAENRALSRLTFTSRAELDPTLPPRVMGAEQSNTSIVFGEELILKVIRRLEPGDNPELELLRFLTAHGFEHIAPLAGWYEHEGRLIDATLGIVQRFEAGADGWDIALRTIETGGTFEAEARELGEVTARMHSALGSDFSDAHFAPEEAGEESLALLVATVDEEIERLWRDVPEEGPVAPIAHRGQDVREVLSALSHVGVGGMLIRTHGDYHLGQTLRAPRGWVILDFEGEPARSLPERRRRRSPLRDVAGMLRSFAYAATASDAPAGWEERVREAFLDAYVGSVDGSLLPPGEEATRKLLAIFELEKAVYELRYELNNRPDWVPIPVQGIARLLEEAWG
jgi:maltokinase